MKRVRSIGQSATHSSGGSHRVGTANTSERRSEGQHPTQEMPGCYVLDLAAIHTQALSALSDTYGFNDLQRWEETARIAFPRRRSEAEVDSMWSDLKARFHTDERRKPMMEAEVQAGFNSKRRRQCKRCHFKMYINGAFQSNG